MKKWIILTFALVPVITACGINKATQVDNAVTSIEVTTVAIEATIEETEATTEEAEAIAEEIETTTEAVEATEAPGDEKVLYNSLVFDNFGIGVEGGDIPMFMLVFTVENITDNNIMLSAEDYSIGRNGKKDYNVEWWTSADMIEIDDKCNPLSNATATGTVEPHTKYLVTLSFTGTESNAFAGNDFDNYSGYELYYSGLLNDLGTDKLIDFSYDYVVPDGMTYQDYAGFN